MTRPRIALPGEHHIELSSWVASYAAPLSLSDRADFAALLERHHPVLVWAEVVRCSSPTAPAAADKAVALFAEWLAAGKPAPCERKALVNAVMMASTPGIQNEADGLVVAARVRAYLEGERWPCGEVLDAPRLDGNQRRALDYVAALVGIDARTLQAGLRATIAGGGFGRVVSGKIVRANPWDRTRKRASTKR